MLPDRLYTTWEAEEANRHRITTIVVADPALPNYATQNQRASLQTWRQRRCQIILSQVGKVVSENHSMMMKRQATLLAYILELIKKDYNINVTGNNYLNLSKIIYDLDSMTPVGYYQHSESTFFGMPPEPPTESHGTTIANSQQMKSSVP